MATSSTAFFDVFRASKLYGKKIHCNLIPISKIQQVEEERSRKHSLTKGLVLVITKLNTHRHVKLQLALVFPFFLPFSLLAFIHSRYTSRVGNFSFQEQRCFFDGTFTRCESFHECEIRFRKS